MLGNQLNAMKNFNISRSSIIAEEMDEKKLVALIQDRDRTIRKLTKKIEKLEDTQKRSLKEKEFKGKKLEGSNQDNIHLQLLKTQIQKTKQLEDIIEGITQRVNVILEDLSNDHTITENSEEILMMLQEMEASRNDSLSSNYLQNEQRSVNISAEWVKKIDILEGVFKSFKMKFTSLHHVNKKLTNDVEELKYQIEAGKKKMKGTDEIKQLALELKEEKKQKQKIKKLLEKAEFQKNDIINKINMNAGKQADGKAKTKEELFQESKQLKYKVKDLQKEKDCILKEATKDKQDDMKKYQEFLKKLRVIKEKSMINKSCA